MFWRAPAHASRALAAVLEGFERAGFRVGDRVGLTARIERDSGPALDLRMAQRGRVFGGTYALEVSTAEPVLPVTRGLRGRPRGVVRLGGVDFRAAGGDDAGRALATALENDRRLQDALTDVHFDRIRVEPDGRPVIRQMGGSVVWILFPPLIRPVPLVEEQRRLTVEALEAFAAAGRRAG